MVADDGSHHVCSCAFSSFSMICIGLPETGGESCMCVPVSCNLSTKSEDGVRKILIPYTCLDTCWTQMLQNPCFSWVPFASFEDGFDNDGST